MKVRFAVAAVLSTTLALGGTAALAQQPGPPGGPHPAAVAAWHDWPTYHANRGRSGVSTDMPAVRGAPRLVLSRTLDGDVYASPIVARGKTIVATENDSVYAFDAHGTRLWSNHLGRPSPGSERDCGNIDPLGITGTPVYDSASNTVYVAVEMGGPPRHVLVGLNATTGRRLWTRSLDVSGVETKAMQERGALTIEGNRVWVPFGGQAGDCGGYKGRVVGVPLSGSGGLASYTVPTAREAGIWTPPGPTVDAHGYLYVAVGNGASGVGDPYDHSDSVLKLNAHGSLVSSFSPSTWPTDNDADLDLGSQGPAIVGGGWVFSAGKSGAAYVLRSDGLGGVGGQVTRRTLCTSFGGTAVVGTVVYVPCTDGLRAVRIDSTGTMHVLWHASSSITGSPVVGGGRVWSLSPGAGTLYALDPSTGAVRESIRVGTTTRFATPALYGRLVIVPTQHGYAEVEIG